jgi:hypothetical protein
VFALLQARDDGEDLVGGIRGVVGNSVAIDSNVVSCISGITI